MISVIIIVIINDLLLLLLGYAYTWEHDRLWRKNRKTNARSECVGVDFNRNRDFMWGGKYSSSHFILMLEFRRRIL